MMANCLYECLKEARLEKYHTNFVNGGLYDCEGLQQLSMQEYPRYGIVLMEDRLKLFKLIQIVKSVQSEGLVCRHGHSKQDTAESLQEKLHQQQPLYPTSQQQSKFHTAYSAQQQQHHQQHLKTAQTGSIASRDYSSRMSQQTSLHAPQFHHFNQKSAGIIATGVEAVAKNVPHAPHHLARKSFTQVSYKPHSDSPIFHCRKTLKFTDSDLDSDSSEDFTLSSIHRENSQAEIRPSFDDPVSLYIYFFTLF